MAGIKAVFRQRVTRKVLLVGLPLLFLFLFFYLPLLLVFIDPAGSGGGMVTASLGSTIRSAYYRRILGFTVFQALLSTLFALALGLPGAYILGRFKFRGKSLIKSLTTVPFVLPSILVVLGFVLFFGNQGHLNRFFMTLLHRETPPLRILYTFKAIILAHGFYNFPIVMRLVSSALAGLSQSQNDATCSLGAGRFRVFKTVTLHQLLPSLFSSASLVFLFCFMSFAIILVLGGGPKYSTIEVEIYRLARFTMDFPAAASLGFWGTLGTMGLLWINLSLQKKAAIPAQQGNFREETPLKSVIKSPGGILVVVYLGLALVILLGPLVSVLFNSLQMKETRGGGMSWTLKWYRQLFSLGSPGPAQGVQVKAVINSLVFAGLTVLTALPLGTLLTFRTARKPSRSSRIAEVLVMLPMGVSPVLLGLGYLRMMSLFPQALRGSWLAIVGAHTVIAYPFVIRAVSSSLGNIPPSLEEAAASLGASPGRILRTIDLPLIRSGLLSGGAFAFALSLGEINATLLLAAPDQITIPLAMYRLMGAYNFYGACVLGTILMVLCGAAFFIIDKFEEKPL